MKRSSKDHVYMQMAIDISKRSTCLDKQVGCIITDSNNFIISSGYNGAPRGIVHCTECGVCLKATFNKENKCVSAHAEQNALIQCTKPLEIDTIYCTLSPCIVCIRMIMNTSCRRIVFHSAHKYPEPYELWEGEWIQL